MISYKILLLVAVFAAECFGQCPDPLPCQPGEIFDSEICGCVPDPNCVPRECEYGFAWDFTVCDCVRQECPQRECETGYYLAPYPMCECWLACDYIMVCDPGQTWDFIKCGCVDACPDVLCTGENVPNPDTCQCECPLDPASCIGPRTEFDPVECTCRRYPCDPLPCKPGEILDSETCSCVRGRGHGRRF